MDNNERIDKSHSLVTAVTLTVIAAIGFFVLFSAIYNYQIIKAELEKDLRVKAEIITSRAQHIMPHFIETYEINEYEKLLSSEMLDKNIYAILIDNKLMASLLKKEYYISGKIRDKNWKTTSYQVSDSKKLENKNLLVTKVKLYDVEGIEQGTLHIYITNRFVNTELSKYFGYSLVSIIVIALIVIFILYFSMHYFILSPLKEINSAITNRDKNNIPIKKAET